MKVLVSTLAAVTSLAGQAKALHLTPEQIALAWESSEYRSSLSAEQQKLIPANPAGELQYDPRKVQKVADTNGFTCSQSFTCTQTFTCTQGFTETQSFTCGSTVSNCQTQLG